MTDAVSKIDQEYFIPFRAGIYLPGISETPGKTKGVVVPNEYFGMSRDELRSVGVPEWFLEEHSTLEKPKSPPTDTISEWIEAVSGIKQRMMASPDETVEVMGEGASRDLLTQLNHADIHVDPKRTGLILGNATAISVEHGTRPLLWDEETIKKAALGLTQTFRFAMAEVINNGCAGSVGALVRATEILREHPELANVVVVNSERLFSDATNRADVGTAPLLGDAASAMFVSRHPLPGISLQPLAHHLRLDDSEKAIDMLHFAKETVEHESPKERKIKGKMFMRGQNVFKVAVESMPDSVHKVADAAGINSQEISIVLAHQANGRILDAIKKKYGLNIPIHLEAGNVSSVTIAQCIYQLNMNQEIDWQNEQQYVALTAFGMGLYTRSLIARVISR